MKALIFVFYQREKHLLQGLHIRGKAKDQIGRASCRERV